MCDVVALGELLIDFVGKTTDDAGYPILRAKPGGAPANYLAAIANYGCSAAMIAKVGDDLFGHLLINTLKSKNIETRGVLIDPNVFTTLAFVTLDEKGDRDFSFARKPGADTCIKPSEIDSDLVDNCKVFHFGTLSLTNEPSRMATQQAVARARVGGKLISFDPNLRLPLWEDPEAARTQINWGLYQADIVKIGADEVDFMWGISPQGGARKIIDDYGACLVYVTLGPEGCYFSTPQCKGTVSNPVEVNPIDTTGAGDIFGGSAMSQFLKREKMPDELDCEDLVEITQFACCAASLSTETHGGIDSVPSEADVLAHL